MNVREGILLEPKSSEAPLHPVDESLVASFNKAPCCDCEHQSHLKERTAKRVQSETFKREWSVGLGSGIAESLFGDAETLIELLFFSVALVNGTLDISKFRTAHGTGAK